MTTTHLPAGRIVIAEQGSGRQTCLFGTTPKLDSSSSPWAGLKLEHFQIAGPATIPPAVISSYLAILCISGESSVRLGDDQVHVKPGRIFLAAPGTLSRQEFASSLELLMVELAPEIVQQTSYGLFAGQELQVRTLKWEADQHIRHMLMALYHELAIGCRCGAAFGEYMALCISTAILARHTTSPSEVRGYQGGLSPHKLRKVLAYISDNLSANVSLKDMASVVEMGPCHFARSFKESVGVSPHQYLLRRRIERAVTMLKADRGDLSTLAYDLGFSSQGHFTTVFRKLIGTTPGGYRQQALARTITVEPNVQSTSTVV